MHNEVHGNNAAPVVNAKPLDIASLLSHISEQEVMAAIKGVMALLSSFQALNDESSPMSQIFGRLGLLSKAACLPDSGTFNVAALQFLMGGCSDDKIRDMVKNQGVAKYEPTGRGSSMYRPADISRSSITNEPRRPDAETAE